MPDVREKYLASQKQPEVRGQCQRILDLYLAGSDKRTTCLWHSVSAKTVRKQLFDKLIQHQDLMLQVCFGVFLPRRDHKLLNGALSEKHISTDV